jgi:hypothetical protein
VTGNRDLFVVDNARVTKWTRGSTYATEISKQFTSTPKGISADTNANLYITTNGGELVKYQLQTGTQTVLKTVSPRTLYGNIVDKRGNVYMCALESATENGMIIRYDAATGDTAVIAGNKGAGDSLYQLRTPLDVGLDELGRLYVTDASNNRVLRFGIDSSVVQNVTGVGMYSVQAVGFNGCQATDSIKIFGGAYVFDGPNASWNNSSNWMGQTVPPGFIGDYYYVEINPVNDEVILQGDLHISRRATLVVKPGKKLLVTGNVIIE